MLSSAQEDPSQAASRNLDWEEFIESHDYRYGVVVRDIASGVTMIETAKSCGLGYGHMRIVKDRMAVELKEWMGEDAVADSARVASWRGNIMADKEKMACRADRRRMG